MARTVETGNWKASSHEPKVFGSGASAAMMRDFSGVAEVDGIRRHGYTSLIHYKRLSASALPCIKLASDNDYGVLSTYELSTYVNSPLVTTRNGIS